MPDIRTTALGGVPFGGTSDRPSSPSKGQTFYNGDLGILEIYTGSVWKPTNIPFGNTVGRPTNPQTGQPYFNGELQRLELYAGSTYGWQNIVAETPGVTGYTGNVIETNTENTITILGTNFAAGAIATLIGNDGTEYQATTTAVNSFTSISATFGSIPSNKEPYDIRVTNPSTLYGVYYDLVTVNDKPVWATAAGSLGSYLEGSSVSVSVSAADEEGNSVSYSSSNLPAWLSLNSSTGQLTGTTPIVSADTTYSFSINASDGINQQQSRSFSITNINLAPVSSGLVTSLDAANSSSYSGSGSTWYDISGNNNNASINGGVSFVSTGAKYFRIDGSTGYFQLSPNSSAAPYNLQTFTIDMWVYRYQESGGYEILWSQDYTTHSSPYYSVHIRYDNPSSLGGAPFGNPSGVQTGVWQNWIFTKDGSNTVRVYLNGSQVYTATVANITYYNNPVWIGKSNFNESSTIDIGSVRYYNKALTVTEVSQNFNSTRDRFSV